MANAQRSLNDLPNEILLKILSYFGPEDLCCIIAKVCEQWNNLAKDETLWKTLCYSRTPDSCFSTSRYLELVWLYLYAVTYFSPEFSEAIRLRSWVKGKKGVASVYVMSGSVVLN